MVPSFCRDFLQWQIAQVRDACRGRVAHKILIIVHSRRNLWNDRTIFSFRRAGKLRSTATKTAPFPLSVLVNVIGGANTAMSGGERRIAAQRKNSTTLREQS
jgi:hypothetical protein